MKQIQMSLPLGVSSEVTTSLKCDGIFGELTEQSVKASSMRWVLLPDGVVGPDTGAKCLCGSVENGFDASHYNTIAWDMAPQP